jgi:hypothetical protein
MELNLEHFVGLVHSLSAIVAPEISRRSRLNGLKASVVDKLWQKSFREISLEEDFNGINFRRKRKNSIVIRSRAVFT